MLNVQKIDKIEFKKIMKRRRIRTYIAATFIVILFIYIVGILSYRYGMNRCYLKYLINMDAGNFDIESLQNKREEYEKDMDIKNINYEMSEDIESGNKPKSLIIHHTAADDLTPERINEDHKSKGYGGIGYHFYIRKDGTIYRGRGEEYVGAHTIGRNYDSIGICLEGNFQHEELTQQQEESLIKLSTDMIIKYNISDIIGHKDEYQTLCPGENISLDVIREKVRDEILSMSK